MMLRFTSCLVVSVAVVGTSSAAHAADFFSVDIATDELVGIDSDTATISTIGEIGHEMHESDMTSLNGLLYAITSNSPDPFSSLGYSLVTIDPTLGSSLSAINMTSNGGNVHAEAITTLDGKLIIGHSHDRTGVVNPLTGMVTDSQAHGVDIDGLGTTLGGQMIAVDGTHGTPNNHFDYFTIERDPPGATLLGDIWFAGGTGDFAFSPVGSFGLDSVYTQLVEYDFEGPPTIVQTIPLSPSGHNLRGLAYIPEPSALILLVTAALGLLACGWRRRRR